MTDHARGKQGCEVGGDLGGERRLGRRVQDPDARAESKHECWQPDPAIVSMISVEGDDEVLAIKGLGPKALEDIKKLLKKEGYSLP